MYLFSKNKEDIERILNETSAGGVNVNDTMMHFVGNICINEIIDARGCCFRSEKENELLYLLLFII